MNFFESQDKARNNTALLILLFAGALAGLVVIMYVGAHWYLAKMPPTLETINYDWFQSVAVGVAAVVSIGTLYKVIALASGGGVAVAESLGGRLVLPSTRNAAERKLLNIVQEMALASGCPVPQVYVMPDDNINAFAAGTKIGNAVIGVTQGAMANFSRDEMQGVIAHEFSHIINGDMRLNLKLIGVIHGIMLLSYLGYFVLRHSLYSSALRSRSSSNNGAAAALPLIGLGLLVAGAVGAFFGSWIKAAVSRQREYLADAAAVQYTRNPNTIGGALQKIGDKHGLIKSAKAPECAHMFFANAVSFGLSNMMASHPPITDRIARVLPSWDGKTIVYDSKASAIAPPVSAADTHALPSSAVKQAVGGSPPDIFEAIFGARALANANFESQAAVMEKFGAVGDYKKAELLLQNLPPTLSSAFDDSYSARALVYAMLLDDKNADCRARQCERLQSFADTGVYELTLKIAPEINRYPYAARLPLMMQTMPALRTLSIQQFERFAENLAALISADEKINVFEWAMEAVLLHYLGEAFGVMTKEKLPDVKNATEYALSIVAQAGHESQAAEVFLQVAPSSLRYQQKAFDPDLLAAAMRRLDGISPTKKQEFIKIVAALVSHDGVINSDEGVLLRAFAAMLDCPLPPAFC